MLDCQLYGLNPAGHHLTNVLLHAMAVILLFLVLRRMTGFMWRSALVAAVFAIHPLRVESVAWVAERKDVLSGVFFMLTIGAYAQYVRWSQSRDRYGLVMLLFAIGLMSKPMLVTLPFVLLLLDYWPLQRVESLGKLVLEKLPLFGLAAVSCAATFFAQARAIRSFDEVSLPLRMGNALISYATYLGQMFWPSGLALLYPFPANGGTPWGKILAPVLLLFVTAGVFILRKTRPYLLVGWLWYLVMLLPVIGVIQVGAQAHADRYTYLPHIGIYVALTWLAAEWCAKWQTGRVALGGLMTAVLAVLMVCAWKQTAYWQDSKTLWTRTLACTTDNFIVHYNVANALRREGKLDEAISHYQTAVQIKPDFVKARNNLGRTLLLKGRVDEAIAQFQDALQIRRDLPDIHINLGEALFQTGRVDEAIVQYQFALHLNSDSKNARCNLGLALIRKGSVHEAISQFQRVLQIEPSNPNALDSLAWLLATWPEASLRDGYMAVKLARRANALTGGKDPAILHTLAAAFAETGQFSDAVETAQRALQLAGAQPNTDLARQLQSELKLYQAGSPYHQLAQTH
jgi:tetratricopeptide (TPR) repeat protein